MKSKTTGSMAFPRTKPKRAKDSKVAMTGKMRNPEMLQNAMRKSTPRVAPEPMTKGKTSARKKFGKK